MKNAMRLLSNILLLLLLLLASEMGAKVTEGRTCYSQSHQFKGVCYRTRNCASVCLTEHFEGGVCKGMPGFRKCVCVKPC
ncbi:defensin-like protein [Mercurialis annua]|uniref:defensin-like protein n=1 Tax=Mercurialis annua TaxID=3986 RepID=UPI00215F2A31|nr:defensin-like protein [Mercurialis annua]